MTMMSYIDYEFPDARYVHRKPEFVSRRKDANENISNGRTEPNDIAAEKSLPSFLAISSGYEEVREESSDSVCTLMLINKY
jgi:hypothetical protein